MTGSDRPAADSDAREDAAEGPVIHDRRRIDPLTGQVRHGKHAASRPAGTHSGADRPEPPASPEPVTEPAPEQPAADTTTGETTEALAEMKAQLAERTSDLQRLQAEYVNYRKRVDRDRVLVREQATAATLTGLLPVLDAIDQAREHGELSGGFKSVADSLQTALGRLGLVTYGEKGDAFDPKIHEALTYSYSPDVTEDSCVEILQPGYKVGDKILRPARVAVAAPATGPDGASVISDDSAPAGEPDEEGN